MCLQPCGSLEYSTKELGLILVLYRKYFSCSKNRQECGMRLATLKNA